MRTFVLLLTFCASVASSQTHQMNIRLRGGGSISIPVRDIQKLTFSGITAVGSEKWAIVMKTFTLLQNFPNPFNPSTTITFTIPEPGNVEVRIFNITGQLVKTLESTFRTSGTHVLVWDGRNDGGQAVASGAYLYQVDFDNSMLTQKMLLVK